VGSGGGRLLKPSGEDAWRCTAAPSVKAYNGKFTLRAWVKIHKSANVQERLSASDAAWEQLVGAKGVWDTKREAGTLSRYTLIPPSHCHSHWAVLLLHSAPLTLSLSHTATVTGQ
jgi:hypothetical protein